MEDMVKKDVKATMHKIVAWLSGEANQRINDWVNEDDESFKNIIEFMDACATNGWMDLKESPFNYATPESVEIANGLYEKAMKYFGGGR